MKSTSLLPMVVIIVSVLLSACSGIGLSFGAAAPAALPNPITQTNGASPPLAGNPVTTNPQTAANVAALQSAFEAIYQNVNPSVVTIEISSQAPGFNSSGGFGAREMAQTAREARGRLCQLRKVPVSSGIPQATL